MDHLSVKEALPIFYDNYKLQSDGGVDDSTVKIELFNGVSLFIPNFETRKKVILKHDIHHLVTGYTAEMKGETEISAWELSTGCRHNWVAFTLNTYAMTSGILFNPIGIWKAWLRGQRTQNLYQKKYRDEDLFDQTVAELKNELGLQKDNKQKTSYLTALLSFTGFLVFGSLFSIISLVLILPVLIYSVSVSIRKLWPKS